MLSCAIETIRPHSVMPAILRRKQLDVATHDQKRLTVCGQLQAKLISLQNQRRKTFFRIKCSLARFAASHLCRRAFCDYLTALLHASRTHVNHPIAGCGNDPSMVGHYEGKQKTPLPILYTLRMRSKMPLATPVPADLEAAYLEDERWLLVQRVVASHGFQRAGQLRGILEYVTKAALLHPEVALREYEIACDVLGRRSDFDPTQDNIVRAQMSQLRRRLDLYFTEEAPDAPFRIVIPKGDYLPQFRPSAKQAPPSLSSDPHLPSTPPTLPTLPMQESALPPAKGRRVSVFTTVMWALGTLVLGACLAVWVLRALRRPAEHAAMDTSNAFGQFLQHKGSDVTIVLPDASLMLVQNALNTRVTSQEYVGQLLAEKIAQERDSVYRELLEATRERRLTSVNEARLAQDLKDTLAHSGVTASIRFARDMHTQDFGEGNLILIGSSRSNPWTELFASQTNFRFSEDSVTHTYLYQNIAPRSGELAKYQPYQQRGDKVSSYADVAFTSNLNHGGYVVLINGSDYAANEAATRYLLHGRLRGDLSSVLKRLDANYFEVFFGGTRARNDAEEGFDIVSIRTAAVAP